MTIAATAVSTEQPAWRPALVLMFIGALLALSFSLRVAADPVLVLTLRASAAGLLAWYAVLLIHAARRQRPLKATIQIVQTHYVQGLVHTSIFIYWAQYWPFIEGQALVIVCQILFAYAFQALLTWSRGQTWRSRVP